VEPYISKVTSAGQLTLPKKIRKVLGLEGAEYVEVTILGRAAVIRRLREYDATQAAIRGKINKSGVTRARVKELVDDAARKAWKSGTVKLFVDVPASTLDRQKIKVFLGVFRQKS